MVFKVFIYGSAHRAKGIADKKQGVNTFCMFMRK